MAKAVDDYEMVSVYNLEDEDREALLSSHAECTFNWSTREGWPMGVIMSFLWKDGRFWLTAGAHRHRISAVRRDPRVSIVVTSTDGTARVGDALRITELNFHPVEPTAEEMMAGFENVIRFRPLLRSRIAFVVGPELETPSALSAALYATEGFDARVFRELDEARTWVREAAASHSAA